MISKVSTVNRASAARNGLTRWSGVRVRGGRRRRCMAILEGAESLRLPADPVPLAPDQQSIPRPACPRPLVSIAAADRAIGPASETAGSVRSRSPSSISGAVCACASFRFVRVMWFYFGWSSKGLRPCSRQNRMPAMFRCLGLPDKVRTVYQRFHWSKCPRGPCSACITRGTEFDGKRSAIALAARVFPVRKLVLIASRLFPIPCVSRLTSWDEHVVRPLQLSAASAGAGHRSFAAGGGASRMTPSKWR